MTRTAPAINDQLPVLFARLAREAFYGQVTFTFEHGTVTTATMTRTFKAETMRDFLSRPTN